MSAILDERFEVDFGDRSSIIGQGGMGTVYKGHDLQTGLPVAVKHLDPRIVMNAAEVVERFKREAEVLYRLNHPNIVKVLATVDEGNDHFIIMEYVGGGSLRDLMYSNPLLPIKQVIKIGIELADAFSLAHRQKVLHRDIKPGNVLLTEDGKARLTDFGVARVEDKTRMTQTGMVVGTIHYLSPEALNGEGIDERTDIWSFGVMLYEMIAGQHPFDDENTTVVITSIISRPVPPLEKYRPNVPPILTRLVYKMLEKDRHKRIGSMAQVGAELEKIRAGLNGDLDDALLETVTHQGDLEPLRELIANGDKARARMLLRPLLKAQPSAEAWYLAATTMESNEQAIRCLKQAIELDPWHASANRMLHKLEGVKSLYEQPAVQLDQADIQPLKPLERKLKENDQSRRAAQGRLWTRIGCLAGFMLMFSCSLLVLGLVGIVPGVIGKVTTLLGGPSAIDSFNGTPIAEMENAINVLPATSSRYIGEGQTMDVLDHGLLTEYTFDAVSGRSYAIWVQFLSISANRVSRNVTLLNPNGEDARVLCDRGQIVDGDNNVTMTCQINQTGTWTVRVLGREGESVGAYFVGIQALDF